VGTIDHLSGQRSGYNTAQVITAGGVSGAYRKQHLIVGAESKYRPGHDLVFLPGGQPPVGVEICKDLDFPALSRAYRDRGAGLIVAPAHDFGRDGWLHGRIATARGIENGIAIARSDRDGRMTISDSRGRILAEADTTRDATVAVSASVPLGGAVTVYHQLGDWFAWLCLTVTGLLLMLLVRYRRSRPRPGTADPHGRPE
jgi:apolipoprotein N-acyltransferase